MKIKYFWFAVLIVLSGAIASCTASQGTQGEELSAEGRFKAAMEEFLKEEYLEAIHLFELIRLQNPGSSVAGDAQFYLGESHFKHGEFLLASFDYSLLRRNFPRNQYVTRAQYNIAECYYSLSPRAALDQKYTRKAIDEYRLFMDLYPRDSLALKAKERIAELRNKLAVKEYENGVQYLILEKTKAAIVYFDNVLSQYSDSEVADDAAYQKFKALVHRRRTEEAHEVAKLFSTQFSSSSYRDEVLRIDRTLSDTSSVAR